MQIDHIYPFKSQSFVLCYILVLKSFRQADDIQNEANELLRIRDYLFDELSKKTGQPVEKVSSLSLPVMLISTFMIHWCQFWILPHNKLEKFLRSATLT